MNSGWLQVGAAAATSALLLFGAQPDSPSGMVLAVLSRGFETNPQCRAEVRTPPAPPTAPPAAFRLGARGGRR